MTSLKKCIYWFLSVCVFTASSPVVSNVVSEQTAAEKLQALLSGLDTYQANFQQSVTEDDGYLLDEHSGVMSFDRPNKLYWQAIEPFPNLLVADGQKVYFYDPDLNQVTIRDWNSNPSENPMAVFVGDIELTDYYQITELDNGFVLSPVGSESGFTELTIRFANQLLVSMQFFDSLGQTTRINFTAADQSALPEKPYQFDIPIGAEIIGAEMITDG